MIADWNHWDDQATRLTLREDGSGIWEGHVPEATHGAVYKYRIFSTQNGYVVDKADPFAFYAEPAPATGSRVWSLEHEWNDAEWMAGRGPKNALDAPMSIYELHAGSWQRQDGQMLGWAELGERVFDVAVAFDSYQARFIREHSQNLSYVRIS